MRGGRLNEPRFRNRMRGEGEWAEVFRRLFTMTCGRLGLNGRELALNTSAFRRPGERTLFD